MRKVIKYLSIAILSCNVIAQQPTILSSRATAIKQKAETLAPHAPISVIPFHAVEEFGEFISSSPQGITFYDVDRKAEVIIGYEDVHKLKNGYGGLNHLRQRHTDHTKAMVIVLVVAGALAALVVAAAAAK